jgi:hypothetical protein
LREESDHEHRQRRGSRPRKVSVGRNVSGGLRLCWRRRNLREERDSPGKGHAV